MRSLLPALSAFVAVACSCSQEPMAPATGLELLARAPDERTEQPGRLVPDPEQQWGEHGRFGWEHATAKEGGSPYVWSNRDTAYLQLPCVSRKERTLVLSLLGASAEPKSLDVKLNDFSLGTITIANEPLVHPFVVPQSAWLVGDNLLELSCELTPLGGRKVGFALGQVQYDIPRELEVNLRRHEATLQAETALHYRIQPLAPGRVVLRARAEGAGTLAAALVRIDPATGAEGAAEPQLVSVPASQELERAYTLPSDGQLTELQIGWRPGPGSDEHSRLVLTSLRVEETTPAPRPPIVLISIDTLSARHLSLYGYGLDTAPALTRFAQESFVFEQCLTNAPWTLPSFMSLMTGIYANANRLDGPGGGELWERWYLSQNRWTLAEFLRAAGYRTAGFVDNTWITEPFGFPQGFETYDASAGANNESKLVDPDGGIHQTTAEARAYLDELPASVPFFLFVHGFDVHGPYGAPQALHGCFDEQGAYDQARTAFAGGPANAFGIIPTYIARGEVPDGPIPPVLHTAPFEAAYDEGIRHVDDELGKFFDDLRARGLFERAWIIVTADHGETMAENEYLFGHGVLDQDVVQIPLLIRPPGGKAGGARIAETVQLADLYPTILELLGSRDSTAHLNGRSLGPFLAGGKREPSVVLTESGIMRQAMLVADGWKLVETEPVWDGGSQVLISHPLLTPAWFERAEKPFPGRQAHRRKSAWRQDEALLRDVFERLPASGLTDALYQDMQGRPNWKELLWTIKKALGGRHYKLYDLRSDPRALLDLSGQRADQLEKMKQLLAQEQARREKARANARPPTRAVELSAEDTQHLAALGYGGGGDGHSAASEGPAKKQAKRPTVRKTVEPPKDSLSAVSVSPTSVTANSGSTGTVTLTSAAPSGGLVVNLSSSNASVASVPASVTVASGATSATFVVTTTSVAAAASVTLTATQGASTRTTTLTVTPVPPPASASQPTVPN